MSTTTTFFDADIERWRAQRLERLTAPDGWLTLIGLPWLEQGDNSIGSAADNVIVVEGLPAHFGNVHLDADGEVVITLIGEGLVDGEAKSSATLLDDDHPHPTLVSAGDIGFFLIRRGERIGLRIKNVHADTREHFQGLDYFPPDPSWRVEAEWHPTAPGEVLEMMTAIGTLEKHPVAGRAVFEHDGQRCELLPVVESPEDKQYFLVFADQTSGKETYGAARFLYTEAPENGRIVLDFNKAYNPPCVFTAFATCPMAPPENRLPLRITAGELKYAGASHD
ncbi:MAG TPA: DUF1684 domain-containing protein [Oleiagrimonas sp.]|nr:DUF1684 domain-containing protein [Oleiagrimonas sp.]